MLQRWLSGIVPDAAGTGAILSESTDRFSGADLRSAVKQAQSEAEYRGCLLTRELIEKHVDRMRLRVHALYEQFRGLREWASMHCDPAGPAANPAKEIRYEQYQCR